MTIRLALLLVAALLAVPACDRPEAPPPEEKPGSSVEEAPMTPPEPEPEAVPEPREPGSEGEEEAGSRRGEKIARAQMVEFKKALEFHYLDTGAYPETLEELTESTPGGEVYIELIPADPWGEPYLYEVAGTDMSLGSKGPDRIEGTDDDIRLR